MDEKLYIPAGLQLIIEDVESINLDLGEIEIDAHPNIAFPHTRHLRIVQLIANFQQELYPRTDIYYKQILRADGKIISSNLPNPQWTIHADETSSLRDENNQRVMVPVQVARMKTVPTLVDEGLETERTVDQEVYDLDGNGEKIWDFTGENSPVLLNSHKYLLWLMKTDKAGLISLLENYMQEKYSIEPEWRDELNGI